ncbi:S8 family serine peptidase [Thermoflavimicrobium daqui]|nr:S8 family serine peptidase [Thermoflavimicrobium daqui]
MKKLFATGIATVLSVSLFLSSVGKVSAEESKLTTYTINFKGSSVPGNVKDLIEKAGGSVVKENSELAYVKASSKDPLFLDRVRKLDSVESAGRSLKIIQEKVVDAELVNVKDHSIYDQYQWDIKQVTQNGKSFTLPKGKGSKDVVVGVIDTGVDLNHPDIKANIVDAKSFVAGEDANDNNGHGTHVAGSIAANGMALGVGPELGIGALKVFPKDGEASTDTIAEALKYAADKDYDVVNMSLGSYMYLQDPERDTNDIRAEINLFKKAISYATKKGVTVVGSAGNAGADIHNPAKLTKFLYGEDANGATHRDPASNLLIRVSAGNKDKKLAYYSNYGVGKIDVMAPGGDLGPNYNPDTGQGRDNSYLCMSTVPIFDAQKNIIGHGYGYKAGTSMAAPKVAGLAGVIIAKHGKNKLKPAQVKSIIEQSAEDIYKKGKDEQSGSGLINVVDALNH